MQPLPDPPNAIFTLLARFGEALSSRNRLKIVSLLSQGPKSVEQLAEMTDQSLASTSAHLKVLRTSGLVHAHKKGRHVWCSLASDNVLQLWLDFRSLGEELIPEIREIVRDYYNHPEELSSLTMEELLVEVRQERVILLDLRQPEEFAAGHLPTARPVSLAELSKHLPEFPGDRKILAYCRGPYCVTALHGIRTLREQGIQSAQRLNFGAPEWKAAGLPLEIS